MLAVSTAPMADDTIERILRLVSEGRLTAEEAGPILDALADRPARSATPADDDPAPSDDGPARTLRIQVRESGRSIVNLRVPLALGRAAIARVPGISEMTSERVREAIAAGIKGPILDVEENGDSVRISLE
jgi:hypothetical protein